MASGGFTQQRPRMTKAELREEILDVLLESVPATKHGPDFSALRKSGDTLDRIMRLVERYLS